MRPRCDAADWGRHIYRELNQEADSLAGRHAHTYQEFCHGRHYRCYRICFDGSVTETASGGGWILYGARTIIEDAPGVWTRLAQLSFPLAIGSTVTVAELESCLWGVTYLMARLQGTCVATANLQKWKPMNTSKLKILSLSGLIQ